MWCELCSEEGVLLVFPAPVLLILLGSEKRADVESDRQGVVAHFRSMHLAVQDAELPTRAQERKTSTVIYILLRRRILVGSWRSLVVGDNFPVIKLTFPNDETVTSFRPTKCAVRPTTVTRARIIFIQTYDSCKITFYYYCSHSLR